MAKYDKIFSSEKSLEESFSPEEAVAAISVVITAADSSLEDVDMELVVDILYKFEIFEKYSGDERLEMVDRLLVIAEDEGLGALFNTAKEALAEDLVRDAFAAGVFVLIDEEDLSIPKGKRTLLAKLQEALELNDENAQEIIQKIIASVETRDRDKEEDLDEEIIILNESDKEFYKSPLGNFTVPIPVDPEQGGRVQTQDGVVGFSDDMGFLLRIDYYPLPQEQIDDIESQGDETYLHGVLVNKYVPQAITANLPNTEVKYTKYLQDSLEKYYYVLVYMPNGSTISKSSNNGTDMRLDAYRGLLSFVNGEYLYIVSSQRSFLNGETFGSIQEEAENIKQRILNFVGTIEFT
jgi:hypothetical protein